MTPNLVYRPIYRFVVSPTCSCRPETGQILHPFKLLAWLAVDGSWIYEFVSWEEGIVWVAPAPYVIHDLVG